jgi:phosphoenolpyruvate-protein kinase (PTS system EI component)
LLSKTSANISTAATEMTFNGNDAVGLFKTEYLLTSLEHLTAAQQTLQQM